MNKDTKKKIEDIIKKLSLDTSFYGKVMKIHLVDKKDYIFSFFILAIDKEGGIIRQTKIEKDKHKKISKFYIVSEWVEKVNGIATFKKKEVEIDCEGGSI